jgi:hypothetical protein
MIKLWHLVRHAAPGLVAAQLALGTVSASALFGAVPASAAVLAQHGLWQGVAFRQDDRPVYGAITPMDHGGTAELVVKGDSLSLILSNPDWHFHVDLTVPVHVQIDGASYSGTGTVTRADVVEISHVSLDVLKMFVAGAKAKIDVNDGDVVWTIGLDGFTASMSDALRAYRGSV